MLKSGSVQQSGFLTLPGLSSLLRIISRYAFLALALAPRRAPVTPVSMRLSQAKGAPDSVAKWMVRPAAWKMEYGMATSVGSCPDVERGMRTRGEVDMVEAIKSGM